MPGVLAIAANTGQMKRDPAKTGLGELSLHKGTFSSQ
jgi:hypothetical protein